MNTLVQHIGVRHDNNDAVNGVLLYTPSQWYEIELIGEHVRLLQYVAHGVLPVQKDVTNFEVRNDDDRFIFDVQCDDGTSYTFEYMKTDSDPHLIPILNELQAAFGYGPAGESKQPAQLRL